MDRASAIVLINSQNGPVIYQSGFSLLEVLLALGLLAIACSGLITYQQLLLRESTFQAEFQQAWRLAHAVLEIYPERLLLAEMNWQIVQTQSAVLEGCSFVTVQVIKEGTNINAELQRLYCDESS